MAAAVAAVALCDSPVAADQLPVGHGAAVARHSQVLAVAVAATAPLSPAAADLDEEDVQGKRDYGEGDWESRVW